MSQINSCPILQPMSGDPAIIQLGNQLAQLQAFIGSPTNLMTILSHGGGTIFGILGQFVYLTQTGGTNGNDSGPTFPAFSYSIFAEPTKTILLATGLVPICHPPLPIAVHAGTHGWAMQLSGIWSLLWTDEYFDIGSCPADTFGVA